MFTFMVIGLIIIIILFLFLNKNNEDIKVQDVEVKNVGENSKNSELNKQDIGTFTQKLLGVNNNVFEFRHNGVSYLLETDDTLILDTLKNGGRFAIKYQKTGSNSSRNKVSGKILDAKKA